MCHLLQSHSATPLGTFLRGRTPSRLWLCPSSQNDDHEEEEEGNKAEGEEDEDYTPLSDAEKDVTFHDADEIKTFGDEALIPTPPEFRIKRISCLGWEEYKAIMEIISGPNVLIHHKGPIFRTTYQDAVADAAWQAITTYAHIYHEELRNTVYHLLPQRKKNMFMASGVKADVPRMLLVHHQDVFVEISTCLQTTQQEIQKLRDQLMDLYASDTYTWSTTTSEHRVKDEPAVNNHSPSDSRTH
jgi:hypothetical protein